MTFSKGLVVLLGWNWIDLLINGLISFQMLLFYKSFRVTSSTEYHLSRNCEYNSHNTGNEGICDGRQVTCEELLVIADYGERKTFHMGVIF